MSYLRTSVCALFVLCCLSSGSTRAVRARFSPGSKAVADEPWRPISDAERDQKVPVVEKDADAEYQLFEVRVDDKDNDDLSIKYYVRVKIFTERGREQFSKIDLAGSANSTIKDVSVRVTKANGSVLELAQADIFDRTIVKVGNAKIKARSFAVPGIEPGVIIEYRYRETFENDSAARPFDFQREIPVQVMTYWFRANENAGLVSYDRKNVPEEITFTREQDNFRSYTMKNVPAFHEEPQMPPIREIRPWISVRYGSWASIFSEEYYWAAVSSSVEKEYRDALKPNDDVKRLAAQLTTGAASQEEKIAKLFNYCQTQIKNLSYDTVMSADAKSKIKTNKKPGDTLKRQMGWAEDVDLLFASLARAAGLESQIALTGDRSERFFNRTMKDFFLLHVASAAVKVDNRWKFYNPGARFVPYGMLVWYEEGQDAFDPDKETVIWVKIPISEPERTQQKRTGKFRLLEDGTLEGEVRIEYTGQLSLFQKLNNFDDSATQQEETLKDEIKERLSTAELTDIKIENVNDPSNPFVYVFKIRVPGYAQKAGKRLFLQPGFFEHGTAAMFNAADRKYDVFFHYPWSEEDTITIELPAGFAVDGAEQPAPITSEMTQGVSTLNIGIGLSPDKKTLNYKRSFSFGAKGFTLIPAGNYPAIKTLFDQIHRADDHTIVLRQQ